MSREGKPCKANDMSVSCDRLAIVKGWCKPHYYQEYHGKPIKPLKTKMPDTPCPFPGCEWTGLGGNYCTGHKQQIRRGVDLKTLERRINPLLRNDLGEKCCTTCRVWKPECDFTKASKASDGLSGDCSLCKNRGGQDRKYNLGGGGFERMLDAQGGVCALCKLPEITGKSLHVDHDHECCPERARSCGGCVRGLLCHSCNTTLGLIRLDPVAWGFAADTYLKRGSESA